MTVRNDDAKLTDEKRLSCSQSLHAVNNLIVAHPSILHLHFLTVVRYYFTTLTMTNNSQN